MTSIHEEPVIYPSPSNPMAVARRIIQDHQLRDRREGLLTIRWWRGSFYEWKHSHWIEVADADIHSKLYHILERVHYEKKTKDGFELAPWEPTRNKIQNVAHALLGITFLSEHVEPPAWIEGANDDGNVLAMSNILLSLEGTRRQKIRQTPCHFNMFAVPYDYEPDAPEPEQWLEFLHQLWPKDEQSIALLQEWFGYILSSETDQQKILLLVGKRRGGKGTIARILTALVGKENTAGPTLASLGTNFGLSPLLGKAVAIVSDARLSGNVSTIVERLLSISGEDALTVDRKYREPWTGRLPSRFTIISNVLPNLGDPSGAIATRFLVLLFEKSWLHNEDKKLEGKLKQELPGILNWSLDGLDRLRKQGHFTEPQTSEDAVTEMADLASPVTAFVREKCIVGPQFEVDFDSLYWAWKSWADENGRKVSSKQTFGRDLRSVVFGIKVRRPREGETQRRVYEGIDLSGDNSGGSRGSSDSRGLQGGSESRESRTSQCSLYRCDWCGNEVSAYNDLHGMPCSCKEGRLKLKR